MEIMPKIIADTYEIEHEIGSGGGGVVYLGRHLRLNKLVVLKGDKRSLTARQDTLRREVDSLKNLSQTYIPQVYDYVIDGDVVYTVMDYIEGESLNLPLERGERFEQPRIVAWAEQLLEAVSYLHAQPPHGILHADIKPANIMLTPQDDIKLIDFNIALMLGEDGAIAVGRSFGYASPEHYGIDFSFGATTRNSSVGDDGTQVATESDVRTVFDGQDIAPSSSPSSSHGQKKLLDARSDVYSIGATLYHLLTGERPKRNATEVAPILNKFGSPAFAAIIEKAMNPNPDLRWQSADEMLYAVRHLRELDPRAKRWRKVRNIASIVLTVMFIAGGVTAFAAARQAELEQRAEAEAQRVAAEVQREEAEAQRLLAEEQYARAEAERIEAEAQREEAERQRREARFQEMLVLSANSADALRAGDRHEAIVLALAAVPGEDDEGIAHASEAIRALTDALGIYDLTDGFKPYRAVALPGENSALAIAPDGVHFAAMSLGTLSLFETGSGVLLAELPSIESGLADVRFIDSDTVVFAGDEGVTVYRLSSQSVLWTGKLATTIAVSADGTTIAAVNRDDSIATLYDIDGETIIEIDFDGRGLWVAGNDRFGNPGGNIFELSYDGRLLAVSFSNGDLELFETTTGEMYIDFFDESEFTFFEGGFYGRYFAFSAMDTEGAVFAVIDTVDFFITISTELSGRIGVVANEGGIYMSYNNIHVLIDPETAVQTPVDNDPRDQMAGGFLVTGSFNTPIVQILRFETHEHLEIFSYDPDLDYDQARLSARGDRVMMYSFNRFRIFDIEGNLINATEIPNAQHVHDQQFHRDGDVSYLEVIYRDGTVYIYSADDGSIIEVRSIQPPDQSLFEEFETEFLRIESPLHGSPTAFDIVTGELIRELERDAFLTYVTQVGYKVITEYITAYGERFGLLLDGRTCESLAFIPELSDVIDDRLIVNIHPAGSLRETRVHTIYEIIELARLEVGEQVMLSN